MKELEVINFINTLNEKEFSELFYKAIKQRRRYKKFADGFEIETYCIVQSSFGKFENSLDKNSYNEFMALPHDSLKNDVHIQNQKLYLESGMCKKCKVLISSSAKLANCPICDELVECT